GMDTELGRVSALVEEAEDEMTPLERRLAALGRRLVWVTLALAALVAGSGLLTGRDPLLIVETAIALAVAAIPEGLPIVATLALARGMWRMARRNALIERLAAVETLGACDVILTDKTGTLTENRMSVARLLLPGREIEIRSPEADRTAFVSDGRPVDPGSEPALRRALEVGVLCSNASLPDEDEPEGAAAVGDPMETALLRLGAAAGLRREELLEDRPEVREEAFDPDVKMMATVHRAGGDAAEAGGGREGEAGTEDGAGARFRVVVKGAAEAVLGAATWISEEEGARPLDEEHRDRWEERSHELADEGLRVLALAEKEVGDPGAPSYEELVFLGLVAFMDPPREDVAGAIEACADAGVRVVMVTGDQAGTARTVARTVGLDVGDGGVVTGRDLERALGEGDDARSALLRASVFARTSPAQKLDIIALHQEAGSVVAMIGDGVNDAPSLQKADIGVAMGRRGTQVAREAADMILEDDRFPTIVAAIEQGRAIFGNIRKFVLYLLSCNVSEILVVALATAVTAPLPLRPLQILFLNLVTDVFPALALGIGDADPSVMERPPRPAEEPILTRGHWEGVAAYGLLITAAVLTGFWTALEPLGLGVTRAVSISFSILAFAQIAHVLNMAEPGSHVLANEVTRNPWVWGAIVLCAALVVAALRIPGLSDALGLVDPGPSGWRLVAVLAPAPLVLGRLWHAARRWLSPAGPRRG
ncbi:MAG TPA: cation-transporting P-type ATPase, partial [Gemmatimonadota bacterium]|nr:cation-transporting P-type ATPase [Gemmatimonadota bacterium]